jgi:endonuclease G
LGGNFAPESVATLHRNTQASMNRDAWLLTEEMTECYYDINELLIIGGVLWGNNPNDDFFTEAHGIKTPDLFWKMIIRNDRAIAWMIPNSADAKKNRLDDYIVTIQALELVTGESIPVNEYLKHEKPEYSWMIPRGCNEN